jgi:hypothetical protein
MNFNEHHLRSFEMLAKKLLQMFPDAIPARTRDCIQIDYLGERGVVILLTPEAVEVRLPTTDWTQGSHGPVASSSLKTRHSVHDDDESDIVASIYEAVSERQAQFKVCPYCHKEFPPEHMAAGACHGCADKHLGIVF